MNKPTGKSPSRKLLSIARTGAALVPVLGITACSFPSSGSVSVPLDGGAWSDAASDASSGNLDAGTDAHFSLDAAGLWLPPVDGGDASPDAHPVGVGPIPVDGGDAAIDAPVVGLAPPPVDGGDASSDSGEDAAAATDGSVG